MPPANPLSPRRQFGRFAVSIETIGESFARVEAWIMSDQGARDVTFAARTLRCCMRIEPTMLHIDVEDGVGANTTICALTLPAMGESSRPLYARTTLLRQAGFAAGSCDVPTFRWLAPTIRAGQTHAPQES